MGIREVRDDAFEQAVRLSEELAAAAKAGSRRPRLWRR